MPSILYLFALVALVSVLLVVGLRKTIHLPNSLLSSASRFPPTPKSIPFIGHTFQVPVVQTWRYFDKLSKTHGSIFRLSLAGDDLVVLTNPKDAEELLGKRSYNYSSRKPLIYAGKYQSENKRLVLLPYGEAFRKQRTAFHQMLKPRVVGAYEAMQEIESTRLLHDCLVKPKTPGRHFKRFAASMVFYLSYGRRLKDADADLDDVLKILDGFTQDTYPGAHLVDTFPIIDRLPDLFAPWRREAREKHKAELKLYLRLVSDVRDRMRSQPSEIECFAAALWDQRQSLALTIEDMAYLAGSAFEAGTDTTAGTMHWFLLAMTRYPDTMRRAQAEIDAVVGPDGGTVPAFSHMADLPYCTALVREVFRWSPAAPGGFPHYSENDDVYKGYTIKAKTMIIPCIWSMHRNEDMYEDPHIFEPGRFLQGDSGETSERLTEGHYAFGFGRRKCPGQYLGAKTIWIGVVRLLWAFDILPEKDRRGYVILPNPDECTSGMTSQPLDFPVRIIPRSHAHEEVIRQLPL